LAENVFMCLCVGSSDELNGQLADEGGRTLGTGTGGVNPEIMGFFKNLKIYWIGGLSAGVLALPASAFPADDAADEPPERHSRADHRPKPGQCQDAVRLVHPEDGGQCRHREKERHQAVQAPRLFGRLLRLPRLLPNKDIEFLTPVFNCFRSENYHG